MPSLRQKVTTYFRQLSFIAEPRDGPRSPRKSEDDGNFITKYLEGRIERHFVSSPEIHNGQNPTDLPDLKIGTYPTGPNTITAACTGPDEGLTGIKRSKLHLSASYADDIDFIDTIQDNDCFEVRKSITTNNRHHNKFNRFSGPTRKLSNGAITPTSDQNANKTPGMRSRKNSRTSIANLNQQQSQSACSSSHKDAAKSTVATTATTRNAAATATKADNSSKDHANNKSTTIVVSMVCTTTAATANGVAAIDAANDQNNKNVLNATKTELAPTKNASTTSTTSAATTNNSTTTTTTTAQTKDHNTTLSDSSNNQTTKTTTNGTHHSDDNITANNTNKLLEDTTERLLREAVSNQAAVSAFAGGSGLLVDSVAGVTDWHMETDYAFGISVSLYENNMLTKEPMGNPIADCYGMVVRGDVAAMALADGVNWGDGARLAARSAVHGCLDYLDRAIFGLAHECMATSTQEVFVSLLRSLWEGHGCILEVGGALSTLTIAVVLPLASGQDELYEGKYVVCACNVGDSLGYVYSKTHGVREFTQASHDITSMRDMRDALGALGPADGNKPELSNLTFSMTIIEKGDIVFLTSDGISDNFDPVVGKFAEAWTPDVKLMSSSVSHGHHPHLAPKRQNKSASSIYARLHHHHHHHQQQHSHQLHSDGTPSSSSSASPPLSAPASVPVRPPRTKKSTSPESGPTAATTAPSRPKYMRSHTVIEPRRLSSAGNPAMRAQPCSPALLPKIPKSIAGLPLVTGPQRHALTLYRLEDLLSYGINGTFSPCTSARRLCHLLIDFVRMITSARRKTLEQRELFYKLSTGADGVRREVELNRMQHRAARKRIVDSSAFTALPGKLDHATVVAYTVGGGSGSNGCAGVHISSQNATTSNAGGATAPLQSKEFQETNF